MQIKLFGQLTKVVINQSLSPSTVKYLPSEIGHNLVINLHQSNDAAAAVLKKRSDQLLVKFLHGTATKYIVARTQKFAQHMSITYGRISIREQRSRWGSCSSRGNLNFNWRLIHLPTPVIDYVIIHELAHRQQMNHSAKFWQLVAKFDPEYRIHQGYLKRQAKNAIIE